MAEEPRTVRALARAAGERVDRGSAKGAGVGGACGALLPMIGRTWFCSERMLMAEVGRELGAYGS